MARLIFVCFTFAFGIVTGSLLWALDSTTPVTRQEVWQAVAAELRQRGLSELELPRVEDLDVPVALPALVGRRLRVSASCWDEGLDAPNSGWNAASRASVFRFWSISVAMSVMMKVSSRELGCAGCHLSRAWRRRPRQDLRRNRQCTPETGGQQCSSLTVCE